MTLDFIHSSSSAYHFFFKLQTNLSIPQLIHYKQYNNKKNI